MDEHSKARGYKSNCSASHKGSSLACPNRGKALCGLRSGDLTLILLPAVLAERVFVLESFHRHPRERIRDALSTLIECAGVEIEQLAIHRDALSLYGSSKLHFVDCTIAAAAVQEGIAVATFDSGMSKLSDVQVLLD